MTSRSDSKTKWPGLRKFISLLTYLYLLRFPLLTGVVMLLLAWFAVAGGEKMLAAAFDQSRPEQIVALSLLDVILCWTLFATGVLVLEYANARRSAPPIVHPGRCRSLWLAFSVIAVTPTLLVAYDYSSSVNMTSFIGFVALGVLFGAVILALLDILRRFAAPSKHEIFEEMIPVWLPRTLKAKLNEYNGLAKAEDWILNRLRSLPSYLTRGYLDHTENPKLFPGHVLAVALCISFFAVYFVLGWWHCGTAIAYVIVLLTMLCWILSGLAFFCDCFRIPVLMLMALWLLFAAQSPKSDHYFNLSKPPPSYFGAKTPGYVIADRLGASGYPVIVVSANGGGIQSAAWTARVLTGLAEKFESRGEPSFDRFLHSLRLISGVSGGSVGTMFFVNAFRPPGLTTPNQFDDVVRQAEESGLSEVVWGMAYPDLGHAFFPWVRRNLLLDRGHALEETWVKSTNNPNPSLAGSLLEWNRGVEEGWRPGTIFNSTFVESGERLQISTAPVANVRIGRKEFFYLYNADIRVATAARLSATFPYISPATRPFYVGLNNSPVFPDRPQDYAHLHVVDGGYFDNSGLSALTEWLNEGLEELEKRRAVPPKVLVLEIRGFPEGKDPSYKENRGWFYQLYAPLSTLVGVWTSGQASHNVTEFELLTKYWKTKTETKVEITRIIFQPDDKVYANAKGKKAVLPLSWHLRQDDKDLIEEAWKYECKNKDNCKTVLNFVGSP